MTSSLPWVWANVTMSPGPDEATLRVLQNRGLSATLGVALAASAVVGVPGNLVSLWVLARHVGPSSPCAIFMLNLSVTDVLLGAVLPVLAAYHVRGHQWAWGGQACTAVTVAFYANLYVSALSVTLIGVDRFLGVAHPLTSARWRKRRYALAACAAAWVLTLVALTPLARADLTYDVTALGIVTCFDVLRWSLLPGPVTWALFLFGVLVVLFLVPLVVTVTCYVGTIRALLRAVPETEAERAGPAAARAGSRRRAVRLAAVVLVSFVTCFAPNHVTLLVHVVGRLFFGRGCYGAYKATLGLSCLGNCLDPFIYYLASTDFRVRLRHFLCRTRSRRRSWERNRSGDLATNHSLLSAQTLSLRSNRSDGGTPRSPQGRESAI